MITGVVRSEPTFNASPRSRTAGPRLIIWAMVDPEWRTIVVDGETFYWTAYPSEQQRDGGPWEPIEYLIVSHAPNTHGVGWALPAGTQVTEAHATKLVELMRARGRTIP